MKIKYLMTKLNQNCSKHIGKVIYALFLMTIIESLCTAVFLFPATRFLSQEGLTGQVKALSFVLLFAALVVWLIFQFGFAIMLLRLSRNESANLGFLFLGFRKFNPAYKVILSVAVILSVTAAIARFAARFATEKLFTALTEISPVDESLKLYLQIGNFAIIFFILAFISLIHFAFVFHLHFDNPKLSLPELFKKSASMMKGNVFKLIGFALRAGGKNLLIAVVFAVIVTLIPDEKGGLSMLTFLFDLVYFINIYSALVKFYFTVPVMYNEILNPVQEIEIIIQPDQNDTDSN